MPPGLRTTLYLRVSTAVAFPEPGLQDAGRLGAQGDDTLLASFAVEFEMGAGADMPLLAPQPDDLRDAGARVVQGQQEQTVRSGAVSTATISSRLR